MSDKIDIYQYLTGEELLPPDKCGIIDQGRLFCGKNQNKPIKEQRNKQLTNSFEVCDVYHSEK